MKILYLSFFTGLISNCSDDSFHPGANRRTSDLANYGTDPSSISENKGTHSEDKGKGVEVSADHSQYEQPQCTNASAGKMIFSYTGSNQFWDIPAGICEIHVKLWGAAGGGPSAGAGGYTEAVIPVQAGEKLTIIVGEGGKYFNAIMAGIRYSYGSTNSSNGTFGFGGSGSIMEADSQNASEVGAGGGLSGVFADTLEKANALAIAGGGGGYADSLNGNHNFGGHGNGPNSGGMPDLSGGNGVAMFSSGGGGGGFSGGNGSSYNRDFNSLETNAGKGGSGFVTGVAKLQKILSSEGEEIMPPKIDDIDYVQGAARVNGYDGGDGLIVISF